MHFYPSGIFQSTLSARRATGEQLASFGSYCLFQSTLSARRATRRRLTYGSYWVISIHALREESDVHCDSMVLRLAHFNPRSPRGERQKAKATNRLRLSFQSTLSARRATMMSELLLSCLVLFQSTLSARRATQRVSTQKFCFCYFNPRSPRGERLVMGKPVGKQRPNFNPRSPRGERQGIA